MAKKKTDKASEAESHDGEAFDAGALKIKLPPLLEPEVVLDPDDDMAAALAPPKPVNKPDISRLAPAIGPDGRPLFKPGDKLVIERYASILTGRPYLDTRAYRVVSIEEDTGNVWLYDESLMQNAGTNWKSAPARGDVFKFAGSSMITTKKKRGRPRKAPVDAPAKPVELGPDGKPVKRKRGRPPGSKNRPKEEIKADKAAKAAERGAKLKRKGGKR